MSTEDTPIGEYQARIASARAALSLIGLTLTWSLDTRGELYTLSDNPDDPAETVLAYPSIEHVEQFIAGNDRITHAADDYRAWIRARGFTIGTGYVDVAPMTNRRIDAIPGEQIKQCKPRVGDKVHYVSYGTPGGEFGRECRAAIVTEVTQTEVNEHNPAGDGTFRDTVGLCVLNPTGQFFNRGVLYQPGTFTGPTRETVPGEPLPVSTCDDLEFPGGTWHWAGCR
jgi:hypothetical protein